MRTKLSSAFLAILFMAVFASSAAASGFAIIEQSVSGLGNAFAGAAASAEDASTIFFNPAGMSLLEGQQVTAGAHVILPSAEFTATEAKNTLEEQGLLPPGAGSLGTNNGGDGGVNALVPNFYYTNKLNDQWVIGLGIHAPFGLATEYDKDWVGRYHAVESDVITLNINPSVAYRVNEKLSIGAGLNAQYIEATLSSMVDSGLVAYSGTGGLTPLANVSNTDYDVYADNNADDWSFGYNLGFLYEFSADSRVGLAYRSEVEHDLEGKTTTSMSSLAAATLDAITIAPGATMLNLFPASQGVKGTITLPASASLSLFHQMSDKLAIMADISWTEWSSFEELTLEFESGIAGSSSSTTTENWDDTWRYSLGATYQATEALKLRTGVAFDETPISDEYRTPRIPGEDRLWLSLGAGYQFTENLSMDVAYTHLFVDDSKMEKTATPGTEDEGRGTVIGEFENSVDIASLQLSYSF